MKKKSESISYFLFCPLSPNQRPINDYIEIKESLKIKQDINSFSFLKKNKQLLFNKEKNKNIVFYFFYNHLKKMIFLFYFSLKELEKNLQNPNIIYEESSWYDTQIWQKKFFILKNDRLINLLIIQPSLKQNFLFVFTFFPILLFFSFLLLFF
jgi:hypothetical protein